MTIAARPFQRFRDRIAGRPVEATLYPEVEAWLELPLREWVATVLYDEVARTVALRLRLARPSHTISFSDVLVNVKKEDLLDVLDAVLQLHDGWDASHMVTVFDTTGSRRDRWFAMVAALDETLLSGGSLWTVDYAERRLVRRVDETVHAAMDTAATSAQGNAASHLRTAWAAAYGRDPDPDKVFNEAIRAVEEVACPLVQEKRAEAGSATLGTVIGELGKNAPHKWELVLPGKDGQPSGVAPLVSMMQALWEAQLSRHGGAPKSRRQNQNEAEAAVHLAVLLVQWLSTGVLRHKA